MNDKEFTKVLNPKYNRAGYWSYQDVIDLTAPFFKGCHSVLDIGSGVGKFCLLSGAASPEIKFTGVELKDEFWAESIRILEHFDIKNVEFLNEDFRSIDLSPYDGFYIFNPFCMTLKTRTDALECEQTFLKGLAKTKIGTKLVMLNPFCQAPKGFAQVRSVSLSSTCDFYIKVK
jgi:hypothetical protein